MSKVEETMSKEDYGLLRRLRTHARTAEDEYIEAAEEAKQAKKRMEGADLRLKKFLDEIADGPLPIEEQAERNRNGDADPSGLFGDAHAGPDPGTVPVAESPGEFQVLTSDELWRAISIDEIGTYGVKLVVLKKLRDAGIHTIGDLAAFTTAERDLTSIAGIGEETRNAIVDAMIDYFREHPLPPKPQVVTPTPETAQDASAESDGEDDQSSPENAVADQPDAFPDPPKPKRKRRAKGEPADEPDSTPDQPE